MAGFKNPDVVFVSGGKFQDGWQGTLDHYVRDYGGSAERRGKLHFYNMKVDLLAPDAAMLIGQYRLERGTRVTEGVNTRLFRKIHGQLAHHDEPRLGLRRRLLRPRQKRNKVRLPEFRPGVGAVAVGLGAFRDQPEARILHPLHAPAAATARLRGLMKSSAELIHVTGALIFSRFGHGL